ncbi:2-keto-4-pentenoate hydratase [Gemmata sp.]|uniref:2-keto-4-pentenoate hydratase n=1 Tax=Gemmata sp. TaxID=1914242 RepID=UPI003F729B6F
MDRTAAAADQLFDMRTTRRTVAALPADVAPRTLAEGYAVQEHLVRKLLARGGGTPIGYKIACTSEVAQRALGVDAPFFGVLLSNSTHQTGVTLPAAEFTVRCPEVEFGFEMGDDVPAGATYTPETILPFISTVIPALEIVDHRYLDWKTVGAPSLLADNAIHGAWVVGTPVADWRHVDFATHQTALIVNGTRMFPGSGAAVLGNPLNVVAWLANELPKFGRSLRRGDRITTGLTTGVYLADPGDHLVADFGPLGRVEMTFGR